MKEVETPKQKPLAPVDHVTPFGGLASGEPTVTKKTTTGIADKKAAQRLTDAGWKS
jgi:hypothetical protein